jgi:beta-glucanase (GH16 family)
VNCKQFFWRIWAGFLAAIVTPLCVWLQVPKPACGQLLDLNRFALTWSDEFDGTQLDPAKWKAHGGAGVTVRRDGYWSLDMATVSDGHLRVASRYIEEGLDGSPGGWYTAGLDTSGLFEQKYGYFEVRAKMPKGVGLWSAFWMMSNPGMMHDATMSCVDGSGRDGTEIDIMESPYYYKAWPQRNSTMHTIHYDGYGVAHRSQSIGDYYIRRPYDTFHTYGLEWNENEYIFYIDGTETGRTNFGGASQVPEYLLLSVEHQNGGWAGDIRDNKSQPTDFVVDYVRVYQYK